MLKKLLIIIIVLHTSILFAETNSQSNLQVDSSIVAPTDPQLFIKEMKEKWCKNIDNINIGQYFYKKITVGDVCLLPDDLFIEIFKQFNENNFDINSINNSISLEKLFTNDYELYNANIAIISKINKIYLLNFSAKICATDLSNSLDEGNNFRIALDEKYGKPSHIIDQFLFKNLLKSDGNILKELGIPRNGKGITDSEKKEVNDFISILKILIERSDEYNDKHVFGLLYDGKKADGFLFSMAVLLKKNNNEISSNCNVKKTFNIDMTQTKSMIEMFTKISEEIEKEYDLKKKSAPVPEL